MCQKILEKIEYLLTLEGESIEGLNWKKELKKLREEGFDEHQVRRVLKITHESYIDDVGVLKPIIKIPG